MTLCSCVTDVPEPEPMPDPGIAALVVASGGCEVAGRVVEASFTADVTLDEGQAFNGFTIWQNPELVQGSQEYDCGAWTKIVPGNSPPGALWSGCVREPGQPERQTITLHSTSWVDGTFIPAAFYATLDARVYETADGGPSLVHVEDPVNCH